MKTNRFLKITLTSLCLSFGLGITSSCTNNDDDVINNEDNPTIANSKYLVSASVGDNGYFTTTDNITSGNISILGSGYEGYANLAASADGFFYNFGDGTLDKYEFTNNGLVKVESISTESLNPGSFYRYIQKTNTGDLFLSNFPNDEGKAPFAIINLEDFSVENYGFMDFPQVDEKSALWIQPVVNNNKVYFGTVYGVRDGKAWTNLADNLITVKFDYPSLTNPQVITSNASSGSTGGYRTNAAFVTENGDIYQHNLNSVHWHSNATLAENPTVFVRIKNGQYDDYELNVSDSFSEPINIWNAWYAGNNIIYANVIKESDITAWGDLSTNIGTLVEINLTAKSVTELNIPKAPYVNLFKAECIEDGKFYIPVSLNGGNANIYEINIGGGANGFTKGAVLDGSNVYINGLYRNF
ncbi:hypothetical protein [Wenyingzhuangia sp. IMCC45467]